MKEIQRYCLRETGTLVSNPRTLNSDIPTVSICAYPAFSKSYQSQLSEQNLSARDFRFESNLEMIQHYLTHITPNISKKEIRKTIDNVMLSTDEIVQDIFRINEVGKRVSILKSGEQSKVNPAMGEILKHFTTIL